MHRSDVAPCFDLPGCLTPPVPMWAVSGLSAGSCHSQMFHPLCHHTSRWGAVTYGEVAPLLPATALNGILVPIQSPSSEAIASGFALSASAATTSPLYPRLIPSTQHCRFANKSPVSRLYRIHSGSPASLLAIVSPHAMLSYPLPKEW